MILTFKASVWGTVENVVRLSVALETTWRGNCIGKKYATTFNPDHKMVKATAGTLGSFNTLFVTFFRS